MMESSSILAHLEFDITLHKTADVDLGFDVVYNPESESLFVRTVERGLVEAWNAKHLERAVRPNDEIVEINGLVDIVRMRSELEQNQILVMRVRRRVGIETAFVGQVVRYREFPNSSWKTGIIDRNSGADVIVRGTWDTEVQFPSPAVELMLGPETPAGTSVGSYVMYRGEPGGWEDGVVHGFDDDGILVMRYRWDDDARYTRKAVELDGDSVAIGGLARFRNHVGGWQPGVVSSLAVSNEKIFVKVCEAWDTDFKFPKQPSEIILLPDPIHNGAQVRAVRGEPSRNKLVVSRQWCPYKPHANSDWESVDCFVDIYDGVKVSSEKIEDVEIVRGTPAIRHGDLVTQVPGRTVGESLRNALELFSNRPAFGLEEPEKGWVWESYQSLRMRACAAAAWLQLNCEPQGFVGVCSYNTREAIWALVGCFLGDFVFVPINMHLNFELVKHIAQEAQLRVVFVSNDKLAMYDDVAASIPEKMIVLPLTPCGDPSRQNLHDLTNSAEFATAWEQQDRIHADLDGSTPVTITYTSGSTGMPKGAIASQEKVNGRIKKWASFKSNSTQVDVEGSPMSVSTFYSGVISTLTDGSRRAYVDDISRIFEAYHSIEPTVASEVPQVWAMLYKEYEQAVELSDGNADRVVGEFKTKLGRRVSRLNCGGAMPNPRVQAWLKTTFGGFADITENYASTEAGAITTSGDREGEHRIKEGIQVRLVDWEQYKSTDLPRPRGEICVLTDDMSVGYLNRPDLTKQMYDEDGFFHTGDIGEMWSETFKGEVVRRVRIIDRKNNFFKLANGEFVSPELVEAVIMQSPLVRQAFVHGDSSRNAVVAVIVPTGKYTEAEVLTACRAVVAEGGLRHFEQPAAVHLTTALFTSENGLLTQTNKLCRHQLRSAFQAELTSMLCASDAQIQEKLDNASSSAERILRGALARGDPTEDESKEWEGMQWDSTSAVRLHGLIKRNFQADVSVARLAGSAQIPSLKNIIRAIRGDAPEELLDMQVDFEAERQLPSQLLQLKARRISKQSRVTCGATFLTGVTGFYGAALLRELLKRPERCPVYCLIRAKSVNDALQRIVTKMGEFGYCDDLTWNAEKVRAVPGDLSEPRLGMSDAHFAEIASQCHFVVHAAAHVNHLAHYNDMALANVAGTKEILALCCHPDSPKRLCYVSTISVVAQGAKEDTRTPLSAIKYLGGYTQTKWVAEELVSEACKADLLDGIIVRPGMIGPATDTGAANTEDWFVRYVTGAILLGCYCSQDASASINLCPVGHCAQAAMALFSGDEEGGSIFALPSRPLCTSRFMERVFSTKSLRSRKGAGVAQDVWVQKLADLPETNPIYPLKSRLSYGIGVPSPKPPPTTSAVDMSIGECPTYDIPEVESFVDWLQTHNLLLSDAPLLQRTLSCKSVSEPSHLTRSVSEPSQPTVPIPELLTRSQTEAPPRREHAEIEMQARERSESSLKEYFMQVLRV